MNNKAIRTRRICSPQRLKINAVAFAVSIALTSQAVNAAVTSPVQASNGNEVTLTPNETYVVNNTPALVANNNGKITGDSVSITTNHTGSSSGVIRANNNSQIILTNSTIKHLNPNGASYSADYTIAITADGQGSLIDISNSTIESFNRLLQISNGATAKLTNNTIVAHRYGLQSIGSGTTLDIIGSDISIMSTGVSLSSRNGALVKVTDTTINAIGNYGAALSWDSNYNFANQTSASVGIFDNVTIETQLSSNTGYGLWLIGRSQALVSNSHIIINANTTNGIMADKSREMSELRNTVIEMRGNNVNGIELRNGSQMLLADGTKIVTQGDNSNALFINHNNGPSQTKLVTANAEIVLEGNSSYGAVAQSDGSDIEINGLILTSNGNNNTGLFAKTVGSKIHANGVQANINGSNSFGMRVQDGADAAIGNSWFNVSGANSHGVTFSSTTNGGANSMQISGSTIETQDGYAIHNIAAGLDLTLTGSTVIGRSGGADGIAIAVTDGAYTQNAAANIQADNSHIIGDVVLQSANAGAVMNLTLNNNSLLTGSVSRASQVNLDGSSHWQVTGDSNMATLNNGGTVEFMSPGSSGAFKTITVNGDYVGGGTVVINTTLDDDMSGSDKLIINGDTSGSTGLIVNNFNGAGAETTNGIEVITVNGQSNGTFNLQNRAVAGAYEYFLHQDSGNWYLRSLLRSDPGDEGPVYRPEAGAYIANIASARRLFNLRLEDREGRKQDSSLWLRQVASRNKSRDSTGQLAMASNSYVVQGGGEIVQGRLAENDRIGLGVMAGYTRSNGETRSTRSHHIANNTLDGYSVGAYATWYQNAESRSGAYLDSWLQYSWYDAETNGQGLASEQYDIDGLSASVETGYRFELAENSNGHVYLTPQAQVIWNNIQADKHYDIQGTPIESTGNNNVQTRLGVKLSLDGVHDADRGTDKLFTVYSELNWLYNSKHAGTVMNGVKVTQAGDRHIGEIKLGFEGQLNKHVDVWTNVAQHLGDRGYNDTAANLGVKYRF
jgi:autotransporter family porin